MNKKGFINKIITIFLLSIVILNSYPNESYAHANNLTFNNLNIEQGIVNLQQRLYSKIVRDIYGLVQMMV